MKTFTLQSAVCISLISANCLLPTLSFSQWQQTNGPYGGIVNALAVSGANLFAGTDGGGVFLSTNNGTIWTAVNSGLTNTYVRSLAVSGTNLFAGTYGGGVWKHTLPVVNLGNDTNICNGSPIILNAGNPGSTYLWKSGATTQSITVASADTIWVAVTNTFGLKGYDTIVIGVYPLINITSGSTNTSCNGGNDGTAAVMATGGTSPYAYLWNDAATQTTATATGLTAGTYLVTITDANSCTKTASQAVTQPAAALSLTTASISATLGANNGKAIASVSGGTPVYTYLWDDPSAQTTDTAKGLAGGTYRITVTDAKGCIIKDSVVVNVINAISEIEKRDHVFIIPNPNNGEFVLRIITTKYELIRTYELRIINILGEVVFQSFYQPINLSTYKLINLKNQPPGVYLMQVITDKEVVSKKVIVIEE